MVNWNDRVGRERKNNYTYSKMYIFQSLQIKAVYMLFKYRDHMHAYSNCNVYTL